MKLCEVCFHFIKALVEKINQDPPTKELKSDQLTRITNMVYNHPISQS